MKKPLTTILIAAATTGLQCGCSGDPSGGTGGGLPGGTGGLPEPGTTGPEMKPDFPGPVPGTGECAPESFHAPLQMLNEFELTNTIRDLLGDVGGEVLIPTGGRGHFRGGLLIDQLATRWEDTAWQLAGSAIKDAEKLTGCAAAAQNDACARDFIVRFGQRAYRRPLDEAEVSSLVALYDTGKSEGFAAGVEMVVAAMLQHPSLLYRVEAGIPDSVPGDPTLRRLTGYEVAQRLSYNFWGTLPDDALFAAAAAGELSTPEGVRAQAERLLSDERSTPMFADFVGQWLFTDHLGSVPKDAERYPTYTAEIPALLKQELQHFVQNLVKSGGTVGELFTADYGFLNNKLAAFYGVPGAFQDEFVRTTFPPEAQRSGLLTFAGLLSVEGTTQGVSLSTASRTFPIGRGRFIRERLACEGLLPPIPNATMLPGVTEKIDELNTRFGGAEDTPPRVFFEEVTSSNPVCAGCHATLEPLGFVLERFGADGLPRELDIDGQPAIQGGTYSPNGSANSDLVGDYASPAELGKALAASPGAKACLTDHWLQYSLGRALSVTDTPCFSGTSSKSTAPVESTPLKEVYLDVVSSELYRARKFN